MKVYIKKFLKHYYVMLVPAFLWLIFFSIVPMFGIIMAFEDYNPGLGMLKSPFVGLDNFRYMLQISDVRQAIANTVIIAVAKIICNIICSRITHTLYDHRTYNKHTNKQIGIS